MVPLGLQESANCPYGSVYTWNGLLKTSQSSWVYWVSHEILFLVFILHFCFIVMLVGLRSSKVDVIGHLTHLSVFSLFKRRSLQASSPKFAPTYVYPFKCHVFPYFFITHNSKTLFLYLYYYILCFFFLKFNMHLLTPTKLDIFVLSKIEIKLLQMRIRFRNVWH